MTQVILGLLLALQYTIGLGPSGVATPPSNALAPTFSPAAGSVANPTTVTASSASGCAGHIYLDTSNPPTTLQATYSVTTPVTLYAYVHNCPGLGDSAVASAAYTITATYTLKDDVAPSAATTISHFPVSWSYQGYAGSWTAGSSYTLTQVCFDLVKQAGTPFDQAITAKIYASSNGGPSGTVSTLLGTSAATAQPTVSATATYYCWQFAGVSITSGTTYYAALAGTANSASYVGFKSVGTAGRATYGLSGSWAVDESAQQLTMRMYTSP